MWWDRLKRKSLLQKLENELGIFIQRYLGAGGIPCMIKFVFEHTPNTNLIILLTTPAHKKLRFSTIIGSKIAQHCTKIAFSIGSPLAAVTVFWRFALTADVVEIPPAAIPTVPELPQFDPLNLSGITVNEVPWEEYEQSKQGDNT